jgi:histone H2A
LEYLVSEVLELSSEIARGKKRHRIIPRHIQLAIHSDDELKNLLKDVTIAEGGIVSSIHPALLPKKSK